MAARVEARTRKRPQHAVKPCKRRNRFVNSGSARLRGSFFALDFPAAMRLPPALKRYTQWIGFTAVLIPLLVLLALQYRSLARLDQTATLVHKAGLTNFLEAVTSDV